MEITSSFMCNILQVRYMERKAIRKFNTGSDVCYVAEAIVKESKRGCISIKETHKVHFYMNKVDFDRHIISVGDRVLIKHAEWRCRYIDYKNYCPDFIREHKGSKLRKDEKGKTYYYDIINSYVVVANIDEWQIVKRRSYLGHCYIPAINLSLPMEDEKDFKQEIFGWFLEDYEFEKVKPVNNSIVYIRYYKGRNVKAEKNILIALDEENNYMGCKEIK